MIRKYIYGGAAVEEQERQTHRTRWPWLLLIGLLLLVAVPLGAFWLLYREVRPLTVWELTGECPPASALMRDGGEGRWCFDTGKIDWKKPGDISQYEIFIDTPTEAMNKVTTDRRLHSSDFIRLKTLTFGITLPQNWTKPVGIQTARVFCAANNLWTWAKYSYYDPEAVVGGKAIWGTPPLKTLTFGVNVNF